MKKSRVVEHLAVIYLLDEQGNVLSGRHADGSLYPFQWGLPVMLTQQDETPAEALSRLISQEEWQLERGEYPPYKIVELIDNSSGEQDGERVVAAIFEFTYLELKVRLSPTSKYSEFAFRSFKELANM